MNGIGASLATTMSTLADCVCVALGTDGAGPTCWCGVYPGAQVAWDFCGECSGEKCGMGYVRLARIFNSTQFPLEDVAGPCSGSLAAELRVGALRCLPLMDDGELPDEVGLLDTSLAMVADAAAIYTAIACCGVEVSVGSYTPQGPQGGCVGGEWTVWVMV